MSVIDDTAQTEQTAYTAENGPSDFSRWGFVLHQTEDLVIKNIQQSESRQIAARERKDVDQRSIHQVPRDFICQSVGHHIVLAVDVVHRPMNTALSKGVTEDYASSKVRPQIWRAASSMADF